MSRPTMQSPIGFVVDSELRVVEFIGHTSPLIRLSPGAATLDLARLLTDSLRPAVLEAVDQARETLRAVAVGGVCNSIRQRPPGSGVTLRSALRRTPNS